MKIRLDHLSNEQLIKLDEDIEEEKKRRIKTLNDAINVIEQPAMEGPK